MDGFDLVLDTLRAFIRKHQGLICMGRSHGVHGEPVTYGFKFAGFYANSCATRSALPTPLKTSAPASSPAPWAPTPSSLPAVEARACEILGLKADIISTQIVQRDRL